MVHGAFQPEIGRTNEGQMVKGRSYKAFLFREWEITQFSEKEWDQAFQKPSKCACKQEQKECLEPGSRVCGRLDPGQVQPQRGLHHSGGEDTGEVTSMGTDG